MSYSSVDEVTAFTRHLLNGQNGFNDETLPTLVEVKKFIERVSAVLDTALAGQGLAVPITNATALLVCDEWVTARVVELIELTQRGVGYSDGEGSRVNAFRNLHAAAAKFASENRIGFVRLGVTVTYGATDGLQFTALESASDRADPQNSGLEQPKFRRGMFGHGGAVSDSEAD
jgi:hypothetical protein